MKIIIFSILLLFCTSCSSDKSFDDPSTLTKNKLKITYKGFYEKNFNLGYITEIYTIFDITQITEQTSQTEKINLLKIAAYSSDNDNYISFKVIANSVGNNGIYNDTFSFRSQGATYFFSDLNFEITANNNEEFIANFSGKLKHYNQYEDVFVDLHFSSGSITITY